MKLKLFSLAFLFLSINLFAQQNQKNGTIKVRKPLTASAIMSKDTFLRGWSQEISMDSYFRAVYPGGDITLNKFISLNMKYPEKVLNKKESGYCNTVFTVNPDGKISDIKIIKRVSGCPECDLEAIRLLKLMKEWQPAERNGQKVSAQVNLQIKFRL
jgi:TonB family protein